MKNNLFNSGRYYNLFYKDKDYETEAKCVHQKLLEHNVRGRKLLELGCGTGKHAKTFSKLGYRIVGIEQSKSMIDSAEIVENFECRYGDIREIKLEEKFDCVISLFHVISYLISNQSLQSTFKTAYESLKKNGIFLFDVWYGPAVIHQKPTIRIKEIKTDNNKIVRIAEPEMLINHNQVNVKYIYHDLNLISNQFKISEEIHPMRYFTIPELELIANISGFKVIDIGELITGAKPSLNTWGICLTLRKDG